MAIFDDIKEGLEQAISYEKGELKAKKTVLTVTPLDTFTPSEIKRIRAASGMSQYMFAKYMGVSQKTVEAWESGRNHPSGTACRLLTLTKNNPRFPGESGIVIR